MVSSLLAELQRQVCAVPSVTFPAHLGAGESSVYLEFASQITELLTWSSHLFWETAVCGRRAVGRAGSGCTGQRCL